MLYLISYDAAAPGGRHEALNWAILAFGGRRVLESQWLLVSVLDAHVVWAQLAALVGAEDRLLVSEVTRATRWGAGKLLIPDVEMEGLLAFARP
jgi:hypothetical protein